MGLEWIGDLLKGIWTFITPMHWCYPWEGGVRITYWNWLPLGRWTPKNRITELGEGIYLKLPGLQRIHKTVVASQTLNLPPQSITLNDGTKLNVSGVVLYSVKNCRAFFTKIHDQDEWLLNNAIRAVAAVLASHSRSEVLGNGQLSIEASVLELLKKHTWGKGYDLEAFGFSDLQEGKALRLLFGEGKQSYLPSDL